MINDKSKLPANAPSETKILEQMKLDHKKMNEILKELSSHIEKHEKQIAALESSSTNTGKGSKHSHHHADEQLHGSVMSAMTQIERALHHH